jgi:hypothetical protein
MANLLDQLLSITGLKAPATGGSDSIYRDDGSTGVEKYLARQAEDEIHTTTTGGSLTGVAKYLDKQDKQQKVTAPSASVKPVSGVDKYLQKKTSVKKKPVAATKKASKPVAKKSAPAKKRALAKKAKPKPAAAAQKKAAPKAASGTTDISINTRCQAGTAKGTQCKRSSQLTQIQRTINKQKYKVTVCSQHDNSSFKPYDGLIKN